MRFMSIVKGPDTDAPPSQELMDAIGKLAQEMVEKGVMLDMGGLLPTATGARIRLSGGKLTVTDGPFTEAKEVVGGYAIMKADSKTEAVEMGRRFMQLHADILGSGHQMELEIRQMFDEPPQA
jgi:hypothetical protein